MAFIQQISTHYCFLLFFCQWLGIYDFYPLALRVYALCSSGLQVVRQMDGTTPTVLNTIDATTLNNGVGEGLSILEVFQRRPRLNGQEYSFYTYRRLTKVK